MASIEWSESASEVIRRWFWSDEKLILKCVFNCFGKDLKKNNLKWFGSDAEGLLDISGLRRFGTRRFGTFELDVSGLHDFESGRFGTFWLDVSGLRRFGT